VKSWVSRTRDARRRRQSICLGRALGARDPARRDARSCLRRWPPCAPAGGARPSRAQAAGPGITTFQYDLEEEGAEEGTPWPFAPGRFAGIVVTNYLHRPLFAHLAGALAPNGILVYETFALGNERFGKPSNPAFLLASGELLDVASRHGLRVLAYEDGVIDAPRPARVQRLCAAGPDVDPGAIRLDM
jgi:hypothetical protein